MDALTYRHEYKHVINVQDYCALRQRVAAVMRRDANAGSDGTYHIRSLYFDNDEDTALREKLIGLPYREKYRIRIYNHSDQQITLEKKCKTHGLCTKLSHPLSRAECERILDGDTGWMARGEAPLLLDFYTRLTARRLKPRTIVDYRREAYIYPYGNVRVTFDMSIRSGMYGTDLFSPELITLPAQDKSMMVLEVKYDRFLPDLIRDILQTNERQTGTFSKYVACRVYE